MRALSAEEFGQLFLSVDRSAFHLETHDNYAVPGEDEPFRRWLDNEPDDYAWFRPWLEKVRAVTRSGARVSRLRVVSEPLTDYIRFELDMTRFNQEAGEDVRWLPRQYAEGLTLPDHDYWLLDDITVVFNRFHSDGTDAGRELVDDPDLIELCRIARDEAWKLAVPHHEYIHP